MKVYLVIRENRGEYVDTEMLKAFSTLEKAQAYVVELNEMYKDSLSFQRGSFYFEVEEMEFE